MQDLDNKAIQMRPVIMAHRMNPVDKNIKAVYDKLMQDVKEAILRVTNASSSSAHDRMIGNARNISETSSKKLLIYLYLLNYYFLI